MNGKFLIVAAFASSFLMAGKLRAQDFFQNALEPGRYRVGFRSIQTYDLTRAAIKEQKNLPATRQRGRVMQVNVWYPAENAGKSRQMRYRDYVNLLAQRFDFRENSPSKSEKEFIRLVRELGGDSALLNQHLSRFLQAESRAFWQAPVAKGAFPLLVYPDYAHTQNILAEYLASHGYIVASVYLKGTFSEQFDLGISGLETEIADLAFVLQTVRQNFSVQQPFALMGVGIHASAALGLQMRNTDVAGIVSLEGGITTGFEYQLIRQSPYFNLDRINRPMLAIHAPHPDVKPELLDAYKFSDRYLVHFPQSSEFYFLNYGVWSHHLPGIFRNTPAQPKSSFEWAGRCVLNYLNWLLKNDAAGKEYLLDPPAPKEIARATFKAAVPPAPGSHELWATYQNSGLAALKQGYDARKKVDNEAFSHPTFFAVGQLLIQNGHFHDLLQWATWFEESYPNAAAPQFMAGRANLELGKREQAKQLYEKALAFLPNDGFLNTGEKAGYKTAIENRLRSLQ